MTNNTQYHYLQFHTNSTLCHCKGNKYTSFNWQQSRDSKTDVSHIPSLLQHTLVAHVATSRLRADKPACCFSEDRMPCCFLAEQAQNYQQDFSSTSQYILNESKTMHKASRIRIFNTVSWVFDTTCKLILQEQPPSHPELLDNCVHLAFGSKVLRPMRMSGSSILQISRPPAITTFGLSIILK